MRRSAQRRDALVAFLEPTKKAEQEIIFVLERAASDAERQVKRLLKKGGFSDRVRAEQYRAVQLALHVRLRKLYEDVGVITLAQRSAAIARTLEVQRQLVDLPGFSETAASEARQAVERFALTARYSRHPLSTQVYRTAALANGQVDRLVNRAIAQGQSVDELARSVEQFISPNTPGGASYAARRLARTELATAAHAATVWHAQNTPEIEAVQWNLSGSHPTPDICDARVGVYSPFQVPGRAHPNCLCYLTPVARDVTEDQFIDDLLAELEAEFPSSVEPAAGVQGEQIVEGMTPNRFQVPRLEDVPRGENAARLAKNEELRRELDLQEAIAPSCIDQLFDLEEATNMDAGVGGVHNRVTRRIRINMNIRDGSTGRDIFTRAERAGFHPTCGANHSSAQLHLAHEFGHHVHHMLDFMTDEEKVGLQDLIADTLGVPRGIFSSGEKEDSFERTFWMIINSTLLKEKVGEYGLTNYREMLAEIWAVYSTDPDADEFYKVIGDRMRTLGEAGAERGRVSRPDQDLASMKAGLTEDQLKKLREMGLDF